MGKGWIARTEDSIPLEIDLKFLFERFFYINFRQDAETLRHQRLSNFRVNLIKTDL